MMDTMSWEAIKGHDDDARVLQTTTKELTAVKHILLEGEPVAWALKVFGDTLTVAMEEEDQIKTMEVESVYYHVIASPCRSAPSKDIVDLATTFFSNAYSDDDSPPGSPGAGLALQQKPDIESTKKHITFTQEEEEEEETSKKDIPKGRKEAGEGEVQATEEVDEGVGGETPTHEDPEGATQSSTVRAHSTPCHTVPPSPSVDVHDVVTRTRGRNCSYRDSPVCCCANHSTTRRGVGGTTSR